MTPRAVRAAFLAGFAALATFCASRVDFSTDITNFMPDARSAELAELARHLARSDLARTMVLTIGPGKAGDERLARAAATLVEVLSAHPEVEWVRRGPAGDDLERAWEAVYAHRFALSSLEPEAEVPGLVSDAALAAAATRARQALAGPAAALVKNTIGADPLGLAASRLAALQDGSQVLDVRHGTFFSRDGWAVVMLATRASAFDASRQAPVLDAIDAAFAVASAGEGAGLVLDRSGAGRFAVDAERSMLRDMGWIAASSLAGIGLLVLVWFRSAGRFAVAMMPSLAGILVATASGLAVFGRLDGLTLAFGASLVGVAIDYPIHLLNHLATLGGSRREAVRKLAPSLAMGALTTIASFAGMALTAFPGFREIGFFAAVGVAAALATTLLVVPSFVGDAEAREQGPGPAARALGRVVHAVLSWSRGAAAFAIAVVVVAAVALPRLQWEDDLSRLGNRNPALEAEEARVRARVMPWESGRAVAVLAGSEQEALEGAEEVARRLRRLREEGALGGYRSASDVVFSESLQRRNLAAFAAQPDLAGRVSRAFEAEGFRPGSFEGFARDLAASPSLSPLRAADLDGTALASLLAPLLVAADGRVVALTQVRDPRDEAALRTAIRDVAGAEYFVQRDFVNELYAGMRRATVEQLLVGALLVLLTLLLRYRRLRPALAAFLPSVLVPVLVLSGLALAGEQVNLLHVVSLIMVTGMGVDYAIFLVDAAGDRDSLEATLVSLLLCCLTTIFAFAVIAVSEHPALRAMGVTIGSGVLLSLLLAPASLLVAGRDGWATVKRTT